MKNTVFGVDHYTHNNPLCFFLSPPLLHRACLRLSSNILSMAERKMISDDTGARSLALAHPLTYGLKKANRLHLSERVCVLTQNTQMQKLPHSISL